MAAMIIFAGRFFERSEWSELEESYMNAERGSGNPANVGPNDSNYRPLWWFLLFVNALALIVGLLEPPRRLIVISLLLVGCVPVIVLMSLLLCGRLKKCKQ